MSWQLVLKDGSRYPVSGEIHFDVARGTKRISASSIEGDSSALVRAVEQHEVILESPHGHHHRASVELIRGQWRVVGL